MLNHELDSPLSEPTEKRAGFGLCVLVVLVLTGAFFVSDHDWMASTYDNYAATPDEAEQLISTGRNSRKIAFASIALLGSLLLVVPGRQRISLANPAIVFIGLYIVVCGCSVLWSDAAWLTTKRFAILLLSLVGLVGIMRHLSARDLIDVALGIGMILLGVSLYAERAHGTLSPFDSEYRFAGVFHPNTQGSYCALMVIAAFFGFKASRVGKPIYALILIAAALFLVLTKSRTALASCLFGLSAAWFLGTSRTKQVLTSFGAPFAACGLLLAALLVGAEVFENLDAAATLGRDIESNFGTLNGRIPLWGSMLRDVAERPILGYGYHGYWTPNRIVDVSVEQEWTVPSAHSAFLDVLLSVGLVGGFVLGLGLLLALRRAVSTCVRTHFPSHTFVLSVLFFALASSLFESGFAQPNSFDAFIAACGLFHVALQPRSAHTTDVAELRHTMSLAPRPAMSAGDLS